MIVLPITKDNETLNIDNVNSSCELLCDKLLEETYEVMNAILRENNAENAISELFDVAEIVAVMLLKISQLKGIDLEAASEMHSQKLIKREWTFSKHLIIKLEE